MAGRRWKLEKSCRPREKDPEELSPITVDTGKGPKANRMAEWPVGAMKSGNADGAKGPC